MIVNSGAVNTAEVNGIGGSTVFPPTFTARKVVKSTHITCVLTASGFSDLVIPLSSISGSLTATTDSLLIVCPNGFDFGTGIVERSSGEFQLFTTETFIDNSSITTESSVFQVSGITADWGVNRWSVSLRGTNEYVVELPKSYTAVGVSTVNTNASGKSRIKMSVNPELKINDTLIFNDDSVIIVRVITYTINPNGMYMTVSEA